jgi:hypothetical protein
METIKGLYIRAQPQSRLALGPAQLLQRLPECRDIGLHFRIALGERIEHADPPHPLALLRPRRERPRRCRAAEEDDALPPFHCLILPCFRQKG